MHFSIFALENSDSIGILQKFTQKFQSEKQIPSANLFLGTMADHTDLTSEALKIVPNTVLKHY